MASDRGTGILLKSALQVIACNVDSGHEAGSNADDSRDDEREEESWRIDNHGIAPWQPCRAVGDECAQTGYGHSDTCHAAEPSQQQVLGDELADYALLRCAERTTDSKLSASLRTAFEHKVDHINPGNCQHHDHGAEHRKQRRLNGVSNIVL